ncbi:hypothetical protein [Flavobacterium antarcticum]|nr:hypothetical protein [Flavobacterium antarcticum]
MRTGIYGIVASTAIIAEFNCIRKFHLLLKGANFMEEVLEK